jgi:two-component system OmpR family sensor kinase
MEPRSTRLGFKTRLALWHAVAVATILTVTAVVADWWLQRWTLDQVDAALVSLAETEAASAVDSPGRPVDLRDPRSKAGGPALARLDKLVQVVDAEGRVVDRSATLGAATLPAPPTLLARLRLGEIVIETVGDFGGEPVRLVSLPIEMEGGFRYAVQVGTSLRSTVAFVRGARLLFLGASVAILGGVVVTGAFLSAGALRPIDRIVTMARRIGDSTLRERLPHPGTQDEVGRLVVTLNQMLERLERSFETQRRFTADASHELRSPLSRLRAELEVALRRPRNAAEYEDVLRSSLEEVERLARLTEALLTLVRLDAGEGREPASEPLVLAPFVDEELKRFAPGAERRRVRMLREPAPPVAVNVGRDALRLVVANLLDNAVKFCVPDGQVTVTIRQEERDALLTVADTGPGIPAEEHPRLFERFYRGSAAGSPDTPGVGLGLAICHSIIEAHGGRITVDSAPGRGARFTVSLPIAEAAQI